MPTSDLTIQQLPAPRACGLCGRPTTRYSPELGIAYCGREQRPPQWEAVRDEFAPVLSGERGRHARRGLRRRRRSRP